MIIDIDIIDSEVLLNLGDIYDVNQLNQLQEEKNSMVLIPVPTEVYIQFQII